MKKTILHISMFIAAYALLQFPSAWRWVNKYDIDSHVKRLLASGHWHWWASFHVCDRLNCQSIRWSRKWEIGRCDGQIKSNRLWHPLCLLLLLLATFRKRAFCGIVSKWRDRFGSLPDSKRKEELIGRRCDWGLGTGRNGEYIDNGECLVQWTGKGLLLKCGPLIRLCLIANWMLEAYLEQYESQFQDKGQWVKSLPGVGSVKWNKLER